MSEVLDYAVVFLLILFQMTVVFGGASFVAYVWTVVMLIIGIKPYLYALGTFIIVVSLFFTWVSKLVI